MTLGSITTRRARIEAQLDFWRTTRPGRLALYGVSICVLAALYYAAAKVGLRLAYLHGTVTALWPPVGVGIAALVLYGPRLWPGIVIGDLLAGDYSTPLGTIVGQTVGNTLEVVVAATLLLHLVGGRSALERVRDVLALVACAAVGTLISATVGVASLRLGSVIGRSEVGEVWRTWWLSDLSGALVVTPVILTWATRGLQRLSRRELLEGVALLAVIVAVAELPSQRDVPYVVFPVLIWAALRLGPRGAAGALVIVSSLTVWNTAHNSGPFVRESITDSLLSSQLFLATAALTSLILAAVTAERTRAGAELRALAGEQSVLRRIATLVAGEAAPGAVFEHVTEEVARLLEVPSASVIRYEEDGQATVVGRWREPGDVPVALGSTYSLEGDSVIARVYRSGRPQRIEGYEDAGGALARQLHALGYRSSVAAPVTVGGRLWGALVASSRSPERLAPGSERRLCDVAELVAQALANADAYEKLATSRARVVEAGDAERRRLERNLHDGAQQRLVSIAVQLRLVEVSFDANPTRARQDLADAQEQLNHALAELRDLARGIHPAILTDGGLAPALSALAHRAPLPVELTQLPDDRLPEQVEAAAYYLVAEAITNVAKHAHASHVAVSVRRDNGRILVRVADDGVGGADPVAGSGLHGLADRVEALHGRLRVDSPPGGGTRLEAHIPLA
jgi:signal transduction histidine kinase/integral membrane sensor domain MASE1